MSGRVKSALALLVFVIVMALAGYTCGACDYPEQMPQPDAGTAMLPSRPPPHTPCGLHCGVDAGVANAGP